MVESSGHPWKLPALMDFSHVDLTGYPHCVQPFDGLLSGGKVIDTVGLVEGCLSMLAGVVWLPLSMGSYQGNAVAPVCIWHTNEQWRAMACDEDIIFGMNSDAVLCEDGDRDVICCFAHTHEGMRKVGECVSLQSLG